MGNRAGGGARGGGGGGTTAFNRATKGMTADQQATVKALQGITGRGPKELSKWVKDNWDLVDRGHGGRFNAKSYADDVFSFVAFAKG